jgi:outer membrane protein assembly factor BamB
MDTSELIFIGLKNHVVALSKREGREIWKVKLGGGFISSGDQFVTILIDDDRVYAHTRGKLFCLDALNGNQLWVNELPGLGFDLATLAIMGGTPVPQTEIAKYKRKMTSGDGAD